MMATGRARAQTPRNGYHGRVCSRIPDRPTHMRHLPLPLVILPLALALACADADTASDAETDGRAGMRIVAVTHGQSSDPFWSIVSNGLSDAADDLGVRLEYQAPTSFDMERMGQLIEAATASRPSGLIVTIPDADALSGPLRAARTAGIPLVSINAGEPHSAAAGALAHFGVNEYEAAFAAGERLAAGGAREVLCVNHEVGNASLDERCRGLADAMEAAGGSATVLAVDLADPDDSRQRILGALGRGSVDGVLTLGPSVTGAALAALREAGMLDDVVYGTFDLTPEVLSAIDAGEMAFAIDQQPYLQGYLAVVSLVKWLETGAMAGGGQLVRTGPAFVTRENARSVIDLAGRGIR